MSQSVDPNHANEEDLTAFALRPEMVEKSISHHIAQCETCTSAVNDIVSLQRGLKKNLSRFDCPSTERLVDYLYQRLPFGERLEVWEHARSCLRCTEEIWVTGQASEMLAPSSPWQTASRVVASRVLTSPQGAVGVEYSLRDIEDEGAPYQIFQSFVAGDIEVNLGHYQVEPGKLLLTGRISQKQTTASSHFTPLAVRLLRVAEDQPPELIDETPLEPDSFFELAPVPPGTYQLEVLLSDRLVEIGELKL